MVIDFGRRGERRAPFRVLIVTGRATSRGPAAQRLLRAHLEAGGRAGDIAVAVAGVRAAVGESVDGNTARALVELEVEPGGHVARQVTQRRLAQADLVLTADRAGWQEVARLWPPVSERTFTILQFARLATVVRPATTPSELVTGVRRAATAVRPADPGEEDLAELEGSPYADHQRAVRILDDVSGQIARALTACVPAPSAPSSV